MKNETTTKPQEEEKKNYSEINLLEKCIPKQIHIETPLEPRVDIAMTLFFFKTLRFSPEFHNGNGTFLHQKEAFGPY